MYAISVWTVFWRCYVHFSHPNTLTICDEHVKPLAVYGTDAFHKPICDAVQFQVLGRKGKGKRILNSRSCFSRQEIIQCD